MTTFIFSPWFVPSRLRVTSRREHPRATKERQRDRRLETGQIVTIFLYSSKGPIFIRVVMVLLRYPPVTACLHGSGGTPGRWVNTWRVTPHPALTCKRDHIRTKDYMDRRFTPRKRVSSPTWGPPPPCKQALSAMIFLWIFSATLLTSALWVGYLNKI